MTTPSQSPPISRTPEDTSRTMLVAGVAWPLYKVRTLVIGALTALLAFAMTGSGEVTAWAVVVAVGLCWWLRHPAVARPWPNPTDRTPGAGGGAGGDITVS
ncbi:hypothetical protein [Williamsia sp. CHRR-6]|uniref:hypothetical protein n=1 Tax=Williamsia sp. CHRR-6 TaxID=2835871 RepID=UPI001BDAEEB0|nr:hypothetical protein [Williamsia sp. CHRR-6]MBT0565242.1 hypothetical protein [Williamsia sp. CHRR-6]